MKKQNRSSVEAVNELVLNIFKLNGHLIKVADALTKGSQLTAARWQVLGAVLHEQLSVATIARGMGLSRQNVQRIADRLVADGLAQYLPNPAHKRAKLLSSTEKGINAILEIRPKVVAWADQVMDVVGKDQLNHTEDVINNFLSKLITIDD